MSKNDLRKAIILEMDDLHANIARRCELGDQHNFLSVVQNKSEAKGRPICLNFYNSKSLSWWVVPPLHIYDYFGGSWIEKVENECNLVQNKLFSESKRIT